MDKKINIKFIQSFTNPYFSGSSTLASLAPPTYKASKPSSTSLLNLGTSKTLSTVN